MVKLSQASAEARTDGADPYLSEVLVEKIWHDLDE